MAKHSSWVGVIFGPAAGCLRPSLVPPTLPPGGERGFRWYEPNAEAGDVIGRSTLMAGIAGLALTACGRPAVLELKLAHSAAPESIIAVSAQEFARRANERLEGRAHVSVFGSAQLGGDQVVLQKLKLGTVEIAVPSTVLSAVVDAFALFEMPYLVRDRAHMRRIEKALFWPDLAPRAEEQGYKVLALWENGFRHITNNIRPIVRPEDLRGIKVRTPRSTWRAKLFQAYGAAPTPMSFGEVFLALQTGVVDGQENPLSNIVTAGMDEVQTYLSLTGHVYSPAYVTVGLDRWATLPDDVREVLAETARGTQEFVFQTAEQIDTRLLAGLRAAGMEVNDVDREAFVRASRPVYEEFESRVPGGGAWIERALELSAR